MRGDPLSRQWRILRKIGEDKMGLRHLPMAFTEQGVAMLSGVLRSHRAIQVNIAIMRAFVQLRKMMTSQKKLAQKLAELEKRLEDHDEQFQAVFTVIRKSDRAKGIVSRPIIADRY